MTDLKRLARRATWGLASVPLLYGAVPCGIDPPSFELKDVTVSITKVAEDRKAEFRRVTHLEISATAKFLLYARTTSLQSGSTYAKLRLTRGELTRLLRSPGLEADTWSVPMLNDDEIPGWLPETVRKPRRARLSPASWDKDHYLVDVQSPSAPKGLNDVYIVAGDPP